MKVLLAPSVVMEADFSCSITAMGFGKLVRTFSFLVTGEWKYIALHFPGKSSLCKQNTCCYAMYIHWTIAMGGGEKLLFEQ